MCEYCGCQSVTAIDELTREHDMVVNMIGDVCSAHAAGDVSRMAEVARRIAAVLGPHTEVEEHGLFPLLADEFPDHVVTLEARTRSLRMAGISTGWLIGVVARFSQVAVSRTRCSAVAVQGAVDSPASQLRAIAAGGSLPSVGCVGQSDDRVADQQLPARRGR